MSGLITDNLDGEMRSIRGGPSHPARAAEYQEKASRALRNRGALSRNAVSDEATEMRKNRMAKQSAADIQVALPKIREPGSSLESKGIPYRMDDPVEREQVRMWARLFYTTHNLQSTCVDIYSRFPIQGMELQCKDPEITRFYEQLFFDELNYESFLLDFGREYWTVGEANALANWNETLGVWDAEEILNPDDIVAEYSAFTREWRYRLKVPDYLRHVIETQEPRWEYQQLITNYPEIIEAAKDNDPDGGLEVSNVLLSRILNKTTPWDSYGTPHMLRAFRQLLMEESLNAAQDAIADRLYAPFILAKLGIGDLGDGEPWIPDQDELDEFRNSMQMALAGDFRLMVHHFGADIKSVFGRESMPRFDSDYDRLERQQLQVWGIGEALLSGSSNGSYASSALNREFVTQLMSTFQKTLQQHFKRRALIVAEAQEHFDYETSNGRRIPVYEEIYEVDPDTGEGYIRKRPKLLVPELHFATMNLRDEAQERQFLKDLKAGGVPISDVAMMVNVPFDFDEQLEQIATEKVKKVIAEAEVNQKAIDALEKRGLPLPPELLKLKEQNEQGTADPKSPGDEEGGSESTEGMQGQEQSDSVSQPVTDISSPTPTPNVAPSDDQGSAGGGGGEGSDQRPAESDEQRAGSPKSSKVREAPTKLPRNQIKQRAEVLTEDSTTPRAARMKEGPKIVGARSKLTEESVEDAVNNRAWSEVLR